MSNFKKDGWRNSVLMTTENSNDMDVIEYQTVAHTPHRSYNTGSQSLYVHWYGILQ